MMINTTTVAPVGAGDNNNNNNYDDDIEASIRALSRQLEVRKTSAGSIRERYSKKYQLNMPPTSTDPFGFDTSVLPAAPDYGDNDQPHCSTGVHGGGQRHIRDSDEDDFDPYSPRAATTTTTTTTTSKRSIDMELEELAQLERLISISTQKIDNQMQENHSTTSPTISPRANPTQPVASSRKPKTQAQTQTQTQTQTQVSPGEMNDLQMLIQSLSNDASRPTTTTTPATTTQVNAVSPPLPSSKAPTSLNPTTLPAQSKPATTSSTSSSSSSSNTNNNNPITSKKPLPTTPPPSPPLQDLKPPPNYVKQDFSLMHQNVKREVESSIQNQPQKDDVHNIGNEDSNTNSNSRHLLDIGLEYKYRLMMEQDPKDYQTLIKWARLIHRNIKELLGGANIDLSLLDWNEDVAVPTSQSQHTPTTPFTDSLQSMLLKEPLFDVCSKYQLALELSTPANSSPSTSLSMSSLMSFSVAPAVSKAAPKPLPKQPARDSSLTVSNNGGLAQPPASLANPSVRRVLRSVSLPPAPPPPPSEDPNSPWADPDLWMQWGDCLFILCTYLELPMYKATCEKYHRCIILLQKQQQQLQMQLQQQQLAQQHQPQQQHTPKDMNSIRTMAKMLRKWGISLSRYSRRMKCQFLMSEWSNEESVQVEEMWKVLHTQSIQSLSYSVHIYPSPVTTYHLATAYLRHLVTLNQFGGPKGAIFALVTNACELYRQSLTDNFKLPSEESLTDLQRTRAIENWARALDIQLAVKLMEEEAVEKDEDDLHSVDEYLSHFSRLMLAGIVPSLEGIVSLCLNQRQAIQYKAINTLSTLCGAKELAKHAILDDLQEHMLRVEGLMFQRDDAESLQSQQRTLKSMPPKLQAYVRMSGLTEEELMRNFEIAWNSIYFLTKDTIANQPVPPNYYRSNKKTKEAIKKRMNGPGSNSSSGASSPPDTDRENDAATVKPLIPSIHRTPSSSTLIVPYTGHTPAKFASLSRSQAKSFLNTASNYNATATASMTGTGQGQDQSRDWVLTLPSRKPTRRAVVSLLSNPNQPNGNGEELLTTVSKYIPPMVRPDVPQPPPLPRCDESIFSGGSPLNMFKDKIKLGTGAFGNVFYAVRKSDNKQVAIKVLMERTKKGSPIIPELYIHRYCNHPNIVSYFESYLCKGHLWIIMEYCDGGTVRDLLHEDWKNNDTSDAPTPLSEPLIAYIAKQLLEGLAYLRAKGIIHRDIKSRNILLTRRGKVKIADFGLATTCSIGRGRTRMCGTMGRIAPEIIKREPYDTQVDIFSLGCLLVELAEGTVPYGKDTSLKSMFYTATVGYKLVNPSKLTPEFVDFVDLCLNGDPFVRPVPEMLLKHSFLDTAEKGKQVLLDMFKNQDVRKDNLLNNLVPF
ncbi:hypothetical protein SAMD00019534_078360 [Acytostelium subglobosum LB1]|uniref:hypothetical protein n=1 Tax=Acytostelium subglobosum LB1 TaxID=1410327 RepID=UPI000644F494|nr:hypothetical protein SAMD00019534_078360 [Acytostelium subglobosum LB1]GAM24661.1 hypothetical protein SAMD00019534_078360 [Acytostelium subglobosum LB1]|eukprot:XP_012752330.1 hypothetical protein SAMD00019534_078360 [Acytostelium subglobosum LB1]